MARRTLEQAAVRIRELEDRMAAFEGMTAFEVGDEALDQCPMGSTNANNASEAKLAELAEISGVLQSTLANRRFVSSRVPLAFRKASVPWQVYFNIAIMGDAAKRERLLGKLLDFDFDAPPTVIVDGVARKPKHGRWTIDAIMSHLGEVTPNALTGSQKLLDRAFKDPTTGKRAEPETILNYAFQESAPETVLNYAFQAATPEAIDAVLAKPEYRKAVFEGIHRQEQQVTARTERETAGDPLRRKLDQQNALTDLTEACGKFADAVERIMPRLGDVPNADAGGLELGANYFLRTSLERAEEALHNVRTFFTHGKTDLDSFIGSVLKEGQ